MAVVRVVGKINGSEEIIFGKSVDSDQWVATTVPNLKTGRYIIEITAFDEAGNEAYSTAMLVEFNASDMTFKIIPSNYTADIFEQITEEAEKLEIDITVMEEKFFFKELPSNFIERVKVK